MAVVVGLALPGSKDVKELDLLPPEVVLGRRRKQLERSFVVVGILLVLVMVAFGALRFLKVHNAENQVAALQTQIGSVNAQIPRYNKVERERATILALASISQPIVQNEVYWPGVLTALTSATPTGGTITTFSASAVARVTAATPTSTVPTPPSAVQIASLSLALQASSGYPYFRSWYFSINGSGRLTVNGFTGISQVATKQIGYSATVGVTAEVTSIRANEFQVPR